MEVTKLSLLLKVVEGQGQLELDLGRILPDLGANIACGNSLISTDFQVPLNLLPEEELRFNPFDWNAKWPKIFANGGFDAVVGNPPYLNIDNVWGKNDPRLAYVKANYKAVYADKTDLLFYFLHKASLVCKGEIGFIVSRSFLEADKAQNLREWLAKNVRVREVLDFRHAQVFPKVGINTAIVRLTKSTLSKSATFRRWNDLKLPTGYDAATIDQQQRSTAVQVKNSELGRAPWNYGGDADRILIKKIDKVGSAVGTVLRVGQGMQTGKNPAFVMPLSDERYEELHAAGFAYTRARNSDIFSYRIADSKIRMVYPAAASRFDQLPADVQAHLALSREGLEERAAFQRGNCEWWQYTWPLHKEAFGGQRIFCPYRASTNRFALDPDRSFVGITDTTVLYENNQPEDLRFILGILNSRLASYRFSFLGKLMGGQVYEYYENTVAQLRIPRLNPGDLDHDAMVDLVERRIEAGVDRSSAQILSEQLHADQTITAIDRAIDALTEKLFCLNETEIAHLAAWQDAR